MMTEQEYDWMEGKKYQTNRPGQKLSPAFLRKPYAGTSAEPKGKTQQNGRGYEQIQSTE